MTNNLSILDTFKKFVTLEMVHQIVRFTNQKAEQFYAEFNSKRTDSEPIKWKKVDATEI